MKTKKDKVTLINMGCSKNLVDSENILTHLIKKGVDVDFEIGGKNTDKVIINTCGFIGDAKEESINKILQFVDLKSRGRISKIYVTGCLSERYKPELMDEIPEVDGFFGADISELLEVFDIKYQEELLGERVTTTPEHYAFLKIAEGCSRKCAFCAIPQFRGIHRSRRLEDLILEASYLAKKGVKELMLISQELTYYGIDIYKKRELNTLLIKLAEIEGFDWIRMHYCYPGDFPLEILDTMQKYDKICKYLDIPLQHINDEMLKKMKRHSTKEDALRIIDQARNKIPDIAIRTTFITGFPGETEQQFEELLDFVREMEFDRVGVFTYSHEENTSAYTLKDDVPEEVKKYRSEILMELQREISNKKNQKKIGRTLKTIVESFDGKFYIGRSQFDSPEVDNEILIEKNDNIQIGKFANVLIKSADDYDLYGISVQ